MVINPCLGAEIFEINPSMSAPTLCHRSHIRCRQHAAEGFYHHIRRLNGQVGFNPLSYFHATGNLYRQMRGYFWVNLLKAEQVVRPKTDL